MTDDRDMSRNDENITDHKLVYSPRRLLRQAMLNFILIIGGLAIVFCASLFVFQRKLIYLPRAYMPSYKITLPPNTIELPYSTPGSGAQVAFYIPPAADPAAPPGAIWMFFCGNASVGLDWLDFLDKFPDLHAGFLLYDYPGYGLNAGRPTRATIRESSDAAFAALAARLNTAPADLEPRLGLVAHSIGAAAALEFAIAHPPRRAILISPFTSLLDMARRTVGRPLANLAKDRFDNRARLDELAALPRPPVIHIYHGTDDEIIPFAMGRELAERHPAIITFNPIEGGDHNWLIDRIRPDLIAIMTEPLP